MRRLISAVSILVALVALALVLYNATVVDRRAPGIVRVSLSAPAGGDRLAQTLTAIDIQFSEPVRTSTVEARFRIEPYVAGSFAWDGPTAIFTPASKLPPDTAFEIRIEPGFEDLLGNAAEAGLEPWAFRTVGPPVVVRVVPLDGTTGVPVDGAVELEFDRLMDTASVEAAIRVEPTVAVRASWTGETVRLDFDGALHFGTTYTVTVGTSAADTGGNRLRAAFAVRFSTVASGLAITGTVPAHGVAGVSIATPVAIRFDAPIDPESAREAFRITPSVGGEVRIVRVPDDLAPAGGAAEPGDPDTILFVPDEPLAPHTTYTVTLEPIVARLDDAEAVAGGRAWSFTTGAPTASGQNHVAFLSARSGIRNVWLMNPDGTNPRQLTTELAPVSGFDATREGSIVVYAAGGVVSVIGIDGDDVERLTPDDTYEYGPVITPDDAWVIVARRGPDGGDLGFWLVPLPGTDGDERRLAPTGAPPIGSAGLSGDGVGEPYALPPWMPRAAVDPTGRWAILVTASGQPVVVDLIEGPLAGPPVPVDLVTDAAAAWSPRHGAFVVTGTQAGDPQSRPSALWQVGTDGAIRVVEGTDGAVGSVGVAEDGSLAMTLREAAGTPAGIAVLPPAASTISRYPTAAGFDDRWPAFSPGGGTILIGRTFTVRPEDADGIWSIDLETGTVRQLSTDGVYARWLP
ncbi:MAG TPA: Ig-like domain-containing protein [Candidatus Limnocylindrales bacterium]|nr:Ig-like domain-containing protein [Candidatus Limnocylindrales bacterium]